MVDLASRSLFERIDLTMPECDDPTTPECVDLTTPEPEHDEGSSSIPNPPITDLITPESVEFVDLRTPEPRYSKGPLDIHSLPIVDLVTPEPIPLVDLSTPEPDQLIPDLSISTRALAMSQSFPLGLQLFTPELRRYLLNRRPHPKQDLITIGLAYRCFPTAKRPYRQSWYYVGRRLLLKVVMAGFAKFLRLEVASLYFWLYGHAIEPGDTVTSLGMEEGDIIEVRRR